MPMHPKIAPIIGELSAALSSLPAADLQQQLGAIDSILLHHRKAVKVAGHDPKTEAMVAEAVKWVQGTPSKATLRKLLSNVRLVKGKTAFDEEGSDVGRNACAADFDIKWSVGAHEGELSGSATNLESSAYNGLIETTLFGDQMLEDSLLQPINWAALGKEGGDSTADVLSWDANKWREAAGIDVIDISWQDVARAVAASVFELVAESAYNEDDWVCTFLAKRFREELGRLPAEATGRSVRARHA